MVKTQIFNNFSVDNIYCLYLEQNEKRKNSAINEFKKYNLDVQMFPGISMPNQKNTGCKLGHINILKDAKKNQYKNILIFEDDIKINCHFPINILVSDFDMFYLGYWDFDKCSVKHPNSSDICYDDGFKLMRMFYCRSTYAYIINEKLYDFIINQERFNTSNELFNHIDMIYAFYVQPHKNIIAYGLYPFVVETKDEVMNAIEECAKFSLDNNSENANYFFSLLNSNEQFHFHRQHERINGPSSYNIGSSNIKTTYSN